MGLAQLVARLEHEADVRIAAVEDATRRELEEIAKERERFSDAAREDELASRRAARRARLDRELAQARREAQTALLAARRALIERVLTRTRELLETAERDEAYLSGIAQQTRQALRFVDDRPMAIRCRPALADRLRDELSDLAAVTLEADPRCPPGVVLTAVDGSVEVDDTLEARLGRVAMRLGPSFLAEIER